MPSFLIEGWLETWALQKPRNQFFRLVSAVYYSLTELLNRLEDKAINCKDNETGVLRRKAVGRVAQEATV